jgi:hypothetical protein
MLEFKVAAETVPAVDVPGVAFSLPAEFVALCDLCPTVARGVHGQAVVVDASPSLSSRRAEIGQSLQGLLRWKG